MGWGGGRAIYIVNCRFLPQSSLVTCSPIHTADNSLFSIPSWRDDLPRPLHGQRWISRNPRQWVGHQGKNAKCQTRSTTKFLLIPIMLSMTCNNKRMPASCPAGRAMSLKVQASYYFFFYTFIGSVFMLLAIFIAITRHICVLEGRD